MSTSLLLRSALPRHIVRQPTLAGTVRLRKARASTTAATQEEGEFKYVPGGREFSPSESIFLINDSELIADAFLRGFLCLLDNDVRLVLAYYGYGIVQLFTKEP